MAGLRRPVIWTGAHPPASHPIGRAAIMPVQALLIGASDPGRAIEFRAVPDLLAAEIDMDFALGPADLAEPLWRDQHDLPRPPVPRVHHQIANGGAVLLDGEILDMADIAIIGSDMIAGDLIGAAEMRVARRFGLARNVGIGCRVHQPTNARRAKRKTVIRIPIGWPAVMAMDLRLELARDGRIAVEPRRIFGLFAGEIDGEAPLPHKGAGKPRKRQEHAPPRQPGAGVDHRPAYRPAGIVEEQIIQAPDRAIACMDVIADGL